MAQCPSFISTLYAGANFLGRVDRKFKPRIGGDHYCHPLIASCADVPFGYLQWYLNRSVPEYGVGTIGENDGVSFDYFIGDATYLGRGLGSALLVSAINLIIGSLDPQDRVFFMGHEPANTKAIKCSKRAGFVCQDQTDFMENGKCYQLFSYDLRDRLSG